MGKNDELVTTNLTADTVTPSESTTEAKVVTPPLTDSEADRMARLAGVEINQQQKVRIRIPVDPLNPKDTMPVPVTINGYTWNIKRGETVEVPDEVARILAEAKYI